MIAGTHRSRHLDGAPSWKQQLREAFRDVDALLAHLGLSRADVAISADSAFPLLVPRGFADRMRHGDPADPLLLQVLPLAAESHGAPDFVLDPVGDLARMRGPGLIHKYAHRVLLITTGSCAVHCRYCFRRHFPYAEELAAREQWREAVGEIAADRSIHEVILSGGDPLSLSTAKLAELTDALASVAHLRRLRIHTRWPIVLPQRVDSELLDWLRGLPWPVTVVVHANHAQEIDAEVAGALHRLREAGATLLNQSVLLRAVNDDADTLRTLSERLAEVGVIPYYLHLLDRVAGAAHYQVELRVARRLLRALRASLPGYLVPRLAREDAGRASKTVLG
ncbi:MAG TPA: EF-P beta-lysylation protein EpmB [Xanthomonadales bacterium]|nr:EF-P beta-lysylation protein EpmB [Xanthomonadales bacterium]